MTIIDCLGLLAEVTYKPGWGFALKPGAGGFVHLEVQAPVPDSRPPHTPMTIAQSYAFHLDDWSNASRFYAFVRSSVLRTEEHEFKEFFRVNGRPWPTVDHATF